MARTLGSMPCMSAGAEVEVGAVSFAPILDSGELLTGTPTVVEVTTTDLTLGNKQLNSAAVTIKGKSVGANKAVLFDVTGAVADTIYTLRVTVSTDADVARTFIRDIKFKAE